MRVSSITPVDYGYSTPKQRVQKRNPKNNIQYAQNPNFNGWGGSLGTIFGTAAGIGIGALLTVVTGGVAAPFVGAIVGGGVGAIGGDIAESAISDDSSDCEDTYYFPDRSS